MGLGDCSGCWDAACSCADGKGWMSYSPERLREIRASIDEALVRLEVLRESPVPLGPQQKPDFSRSIRIRID